MAVNLLKKGAELLASLRETTHSQLVSIQRAGVTTANVVATIGRTQDLRQDDSGVIVAEETRDFKIKASDYKFAGVVSAPAVGDVILDSSSGTQVRYVVLPITGEDAARWADPYGVTWRIHTKRKNA